MNIFSSISLKIGGIRLVGAVDGNFEVSTEFRKSYCEVSVVIEAVIVKKQLLFVFSRYIETVTRSVMHLFRPDYFK